MQPLGRRLLADENWIPLPESGLSLEQLLAFQKRLVKWLIENREFTGSETCKLFTDAADARVRLRTVIPAGFTVVFGFGTEALTYFLPAAGNHRVIATLHQMPTAVLDVVDLGSIGFDLHSHALLLSEILQTVADDENPQPAGIHSALSKFIAKDLPPLISMFKDLSEDANFPAIGAKMWPMVQLLVSRKYQGAKYCLLTGAVLPVATNRNSLAMHLKRVTRVMHVFVMDTVIASLCKFILLSYLL